MPNTPPKIPSSNPTKLNIEPIGPQLEREMREDIIPSQRKPGKTADPKILSTQESESIARKENPVQKPSSAPADVDSTKNVSSWLGYDNPWLLKRSE